MPLSDGDPADAADVWLRVITNANHVRKDGKLNHQAFKGAMTSPDTARGWQHELSGRLKSLIGDVEAEGLEDVVGPRRKLLPILTGRAE